MYLQFRKGFESFHWDHPWLSRLISAVPLVNEVSDVCMKRGLGTIEGR